MPLLGRDQECRALLGVLDAARDGKSGVLVVRGEPGIGKTALLQHVLEVAGNVRSVGVTGVESERELGYAALHRLIGPFLDRRELLPGPQRDALGVAFGVVSGTRADRFLVCLAVLTLLADVATEQPLVCVCDDAQWVDQESLQVLGFLARRLEADPVAMFFGVRDGTEDDPGWNPVTALDDLPTLRLRGLPADDARTLAVAAAGGRFDDLELDRVVAETDGNPLAIRELALDWTHDRGQPDGVPLAERLPLGGVLEARFQRRIRELPEPAQTLLLVVASDPTGDAGLVWRALTALGATAGAQSLVEAAKPALSHDLLALTPALSFRHPLIRSASYRGADVDARRRVHAALAAAIPTGTDIDRRAWHLAAAHPGLDEGIAAELENAALRARDRAGYSAEAAFLAASADRTIDVERRAGRLQNAAVAAIRAGLPGRAYALLERAPAGAGPVSRAVLSITRGATCIQLDRFDEGIALMFEAAEQLCAVLPRPLAREALLEALQTVTMVPWVGRATLVRLLSSPTGDVADLPESPGAVDLLLAAHRAQVLGVVDVDVEALRRAVEALRAEFGTELPDRWVALLMATLRELFDDGLMVEVTERIIVRCREAGSSTGIRVALIGRGLTEALFGRLGAAELYFEEARQVSAEHGGTAYSRRPHDSLLKAWQGDAEAVARAATDVPSPPPGQVVGGAPVQHVRTAQAVVALGASRYGEALDAARRVYDDDPPYWGQFALPDLVEAGVRGGDRAIAEKALQRFDVRARACGTPWALGMVARSRALLTDGPEAEALYREAVDRLATTRVAGEQARAHLLYGEWLRRRRRRTEARRELGRAHEMFTAMGAAGFAERTRTELVAAGASVRRPARGAAEVLTAHEARIARLAAGGATNQQIATELYISPNTVEYHLRKVFRKVGVNSRRELDPVALEA